MKLKKNQIRKQLSYKTMLSIFALVLFTNCTKNPLSCFNGSWIQEVSEDLDKWTAASSAYSEEPTEENCASYKSAISAYLTALDNVQDCVPAGSISDFDGSLDEARQELSEIDCTTNN